MCRSATVALPVCHMYPNPIHAAERFPATAKMPMHTLTEAAATSIKQIQHQMHIQRDSSLKTPQRCNEAQMQVGVSHSLHVFRQ